jgi:hypothetical protein
MSAIELSLLPNLGRETICLPILPVLLRIALATQIHTQKCNTQRSFVQINVVIQGAEAHGNDGILMMVKGLFGEVERLTSEVVKLISEVGTELP